MLDMPLNVNFYIVAKNIDNAILRKPFPEFLDKNFTPFMKCLSKGPPFYRAIPPAPLPPAWILSSKMNGGLIASDRSFSGSICPKIRLGALRRRKKFVLRTPLRQILASVIRTKFNNGFLAVRPVAVLLVRPEICQRVVLNPLGLLPRYPNQFQCLLTR